MLTLRLRLLKKPDGSPVLTCTRPDGSVTYEHHKTPFMVYHDLTHFAIESVLGLRGGFYGMLARGWDITDFGSPWPRGPIPADAAADAALAEHLAGAFDLEHGIGLRVEATAFNRRFAATCRDDGLPEARPVTESELAQIRAVYAPLAGQWMALPNGEAMELTFALEPSA